MHDGVQHLWRVDEGDGIGDLKHLPSPRSRRPSHPQGEEFSDASGVSVVRGTLTAGYERETFDDRSERSLAEHMPHDGCFEALSYPTRPILLGNASEGLETAGRSRSGRVRRGGSPPKAYVGWCHSLGEREVAGSDRHYEQCRRGSRMCLVHVAHRRGGRPPLGVSVL